MNWLAPHDPISAWMHGLWISTVNVILAYAPLRAQQSRQKMHSIPLVPRRLRQCSIVADLLAQLRHAGARQLPPVRVDQMRASNRQRLRRPFQAQ